MLKIDRVVTIVTSSCSKMCSESCPFLGYGNRNDRCRFFDVPIVNYLRPASCTDYFSDKMNQVPDHFRDATKKIETTSEYAKLALRVARIVEEKQLAYGDSFGKCGGFLKLLYPDGIPVEKYTDALCVVRIFDKLMRIATDKDALGESPYADILGYALLGLRRSEETR